MSCSVGNRRRHWHPTPVFLPGESQGWGSLVGCRLWGRTESNTTEVTQQRCPNKKKMLCEDTNAHKECHVITEAETGDAAASQEA